MTPFILLRRMLESRLSHTASLWFRIASEEIANGVDDARCAGLVSMASRHARDSTALDPTADERKRADKVVEGWNPERWGMLETLRVALVLSRTDLDAERGALSIEQLFSYADEGEQRALYRSLALLPAPDRFAWRAGEGCRTNITPVFEAVVLDTPFPVRYFDDIAWNQAAIKAVFMGVPLWRMWELDTRLSAELARMALDLVAERRSAHRDVQPDLWLCLGSHGGSRGMTAIQEELAASNSNTMGRRAAAYALARAGNSARLELLLEIEGEPSVRSSMQDALAGHVASSVFKNLRPEEGA